MRTMFLVKITTLNFLLTLFRYIRIFHKSNIHPCMMNMFSKYARIATVPEGVGGKVEPKYFEHGNLKEIWKKYKFLLQLFFVINVSLLSKLTFLTFKLQFQDLLFSRTFVMKIMIMCASILHVWPRSDVWLRVMGDRGLLLAGFSHFSDWRLFQSMAFHVALFHTQLLRPKGLARIWTAIAGFRVQSANRYTTRPDIWKSLFALCGLKKANILLSVRLSNCFHLLVESARALMILRMIWLEPIFCNRICLKFRHRDSNPGRSGESRVS